MTMKGKSYYLSLLAVTMLVAASFTAFVSLGSENTTSFNAEGEGGGTGGGKVTS